MKKSLNRFKIQSQKYMLFTHILSRQQESRI